jgi:hypothetical protein
MPHKPEVGFGTLPSGVTLCHVKVAHAIEEPGDHHGDLAQSAESARAGTTFNAVIRFVMSITSILRYTFQAYDN